MQNGTINLVRGDDQVVGVTVFTSSGTAFNLSGYSLNFVARQNQLSSSPPYLTEITPATGHINALSGLSQITFAGADTRGLDDLPHYFDIKLIYSGGVPTTTLMYGTFTLLAF